MAALLFVCLLASSGFTQTKPVPILGSEIRPFTSTKTGRSYDIYIQVPAEYGSNRDKKYPVIYILDGQWDFKLFDSVYGGLFYDKFVPAMILVGVTYSGPNPNYESLRAMDYTPTATAEVNGSGAGPHFLAFLKTELIPFIESNYRSDPAQRVLAGSSYGGLFTLYAMFAEQGLFSRFICASPAVLYDNRYSFRQEADYSAKHKELPGRLYLAVGEQESLTQPVKDFMQVMTSRNYKGLKLSTRVIEGERHASNKPEIYNRGLRFVFQQD